MADLKLVGAVAIKVRPNAKGFKKDTEDQIRDQLKNTEAKVKVKVELDEGKVEQDAEKLEKKVDGKTVTWNVKLDNDSVRAAQRKLNSLLAPTHEIKFKAGDDATMKAAAAELAKLAEAAEVELTISEDKKGFEEVLRKIDEVRRQNIELPPIKFTTDEESLARVEKQMRDNIDRIPVKLQYNKDAQGLRKIIAEIDAELAKVMAVEIETVLKPSNLAFTKARMEAELGKQKIEIEYEEDLASLKAARARILALLPIEHKTHIKAELNEASLLEALAKMDAMIAAAQASSKTTDIEPKVKPKASVPDFLKVGAEIKALTRDQTIGVFVKLNNAGILLAATKLTGLRAAARWSEELGRSLGTLDRNLPVVAGVTLTLLQLSGVLTNLTANAFSLGNELGAVVRMGGVLLPAMVLGLASAMIVAQGVFKDFGAAVNGDQKAIDKLTASGQKAAANIRTTFQEIREVISKNFWDAASENMLRFTETALPQVRDGLAKISTSMAGVFGAILDASSRFAELNGFDVFFANLNRGFENLGRGLAPFMTAFLNLAVLGSTVFPRIGAAFDEMSIKFLQWVNEVAADGTLNRWIDRGIEGLHDLVAAGGSIVRAWGNIGMAAQAAGALTLQSFAALMAKFDQFTASASFQRNMTNIFKGAREGSENFKESLKDVGPVMDLFSVTIKNALSNSGKAFGAFAQDIGDLFSSTNLDTGLTAFLRGLEEMFRSLRPAMAPISEIVRTFGQILGQVAIDSGPLFLSLFKQLASVLTTAWSALQPFLPALIQIGTSILDILGPAMTTLAGTLIPAFASGLQDIGDGMVPIIAFVADLVVGFAAWASALPTPVIVGLATGVLALGSSFKFLHSIVPLATVAMQAYGVAAAVAGIRAQLLVPVLGLVLAGLAALTAGLVTEFATQQANATPYANDYAQALREDAEAAKELGHVVQSSQIRTAIKDLFDSGAYDNAAKLGIATQTVTDAVVKGGPAWNEIQKRVAAANKAYADAVIASSKTAEAQTSYGDKLSLVTPQIKANKDAADALTNGLNLNRDSASKAKKQIDLEAEAQRAAGIQAEDHAKKMALLNEAMDKVPGFAGAAATASKTLTDVFASSAAKVDAMRKTFDLLVGTSPKQQMAETLGAYVKGFNDLKETVGPLKDKMLELGDAVYGEDGFLNVAGGNKAVLQVNQALVDQVNNVWAGAKAAYEAAIKQGDNATVAFEKSKQFIADRKGDYDQLATESGIAAEKVQGQWDAIFGHEWVLRVSLNGLTEVTTKAQAMVNLLGGQFDGQKFLAYLDANPDEALKAFADADGVAQRWISKEFKAKLGLQPNDVEDQVRRAVGYTEEQWEKADFSTILSVAKETPGLAEALIAIHNGVQGVDLEAVIKAAADGTSVEEARNKLDELKAQRVAPIVVDAETAEAKRKFDNITADALTLGGLRPMPLVDADTEPFDGKYNTTHAKALTLGGLRPEPIIDTNNVPANTKIDDTQSKLDGVAKSRPNPFVDANTGTAEVKVKGIQGFLDTVSKSRPNPTVTAVDNATAVLQGIINMLGGIRNKEFTVTTRYLTSGNPVAGGGEVIVNPFENANGNIFRNNTVVKSFANGGVERHVAQIASGRGPVRIWGERETHGEAYIPYAQSKRPRSLSILSKVAKDFGYQLTQATNFASGAAIGTTVPTRTSQTSVTVGTINTVDPESAVRKLRALQQDALALEGIN